MSDENPRLAKALEHAGRTLVINAVLIPMLLAAILLPLIGELYLVVFEPKPWAAEIGGLRAALVKLIAYAPALAAAWAVMALQPVLDEHCQGRFVSAKSSAAFQWAGIWALAAFLLKLLVSPLAISLLGGPAFNWRSDPLDLALMAFAVAVLMIGGVLQAAAAALKAENDQIV
ncbi:MAG: hypothetical protein ABL883_10015 [Terricaulis sp.]